MFNYRIIYNSIIRSLYALNIISFQKFSQYIYFSKLVIYYFLSNNNIPSLNKLLNKEKII